MGRALFETNHMLERVDVFEKIAQCFLRNLRLQTVHGQKGTTEYADALSWAALAIDKVSICGFFPSC
jgi:hypothetical protein